MADFIKGMDVSTIIEQEECGARYYDLDGKEGDLLDILGQYGCNYVRLRLWNDPYAPDGRKYGAGTNDLDKTIEIARRAKAHNMGILLDFQYSDFWADPGKQNIPKAWQHLDTDGLVDAVYDYTTTVLRDMTEAGCEPDMVQVGNEITNGLLWPNGKKPEYDNIARFVSAGIRAVNDHNQSIKTMIHLDNGGNNPMYVDWFDHYMQKGRDFDIIGMSYYPFWHGTIKQLEYNMRDMSARYGKDIVIAEVSMGFTMEDYAAYEKREANDRKGYATKPELVAKLEYPMTPKGQCDFMNRIMKLITDVKGGLGFFYWEPGWTPVPGVGWAEDAALEYTGEAGPGGNEWANQVLFDYEGHGLPVLRTISEF